MQKMMGCVVGILLWCASPVWAARSAIDPDHRSVEFKIRHLLSYVKGTLNAFEGQFEYDPDDPDDWKAEATIHVGSIDTRVEKRDEHLRSKDFFDVAKYPTMAFRSTKVSDVAPTSAKLHGLLTIHGVEKPVVLDVTIHGVAKDPWGNVRAGFTATTTVNRKDFGIIWNQVMETGQVLVGEDVEIMIEVEGIEQ